MSHWEGWIEPSGSAQIAMPLSVRRLHITGLTAVFIHQLVIGGYTVVQLVGKQIGDGGTPCSHCRDLPSSRIRMKRRSNKAESITTKEKKQSKTQSLLHGC